MVYLLYYPLEWSKAFNVSTVGVNGSFSLYPNQKNPHKEFLPTLEFGVKIISGAQPFSLTTLIIIVPRYIFVNLLPYPISITQFISDQEIELQPKQEIVFHYHKVTKPSDKKIIIGDLPKIRQKNLDNSVSWSYPFSIDDIDDFEIPYQSNATEAIYSKEWYYPTEETKYRKCVRVSISSTDHATLFIAFSLPRINLKNFNRLSGLCNRKQDISVNNNKAS